MAPAVPHGMAVAAHVSDVHPPVVLGQFQPERDRSVAPRDQARKGRAESDQQRSDITHTKRHGTERTRAQRGDNAGNHATPMVDLTDGDRGLKPSIIAPGGESP